MEQWLNMSAYGVGLAAVAWAAARPRLFDAAWRGRIWVAALVGLALLLGLALLNGGGGTSLLPLAPSGAEALRAQGDVWRPGPSDGGRPAWIQLPAIPLPASFLVLTWALVFAWRSARLIVAVFRIRAARAASRPLHGSQARRLPEWTAANAGRFTLVLSDRVPAPSMLGFGRPLVAVPSGWLERLPDEALDAILLHELAHAERRDDLAELAQELLLAACWFHPAAWWIASRIAFEREAACDDRAARLTTTRRYARCLVTVAEAMQGSRLRRPALVASSVAPRRQLTRRVEELLALDARRRLTRSAHLAAPVFASIIALVAAAPALPPVFDVTARVMPRLPQASQPSSRSVQGPAIGATPPSTERKSRAEARIAPSATASVKSRTGRGEAAARESYRTEAGESHVTETEGNGIAVAQFPFEGARQNAETAVTTAAVEGPLGMRGWNGHLVPAVTVGNGGNLHAETEPSAGAAAPFRALGVAFSRAGVSTGRWFSRAGTSVASAVVSE